MFSFVPVLPLAMMAQQRGALTFCVTAVGQVHRSFVVSSSSLVMVAQSRGDLSPLAPLSLRMVALRSCAPFPLEGLHRQCLAVIGAARFPLPCRCHRSPVA